MGQDRLDAAGGGPGGLIVLRIALLLVLMAVPAAAAELRPLSDRDICLDGGTEVRPGINRIQLSACNDSGGQNFRRGRQSTIFVGELCLQAVSVKGSEKIELAAMRCHGRDGQRWVMTRGGQLTSGQNLCLAVVGEEPDRNVEMKPCLKRDDEGVVTQKWAIYGKFD